MTRRQSEFVSTEEFARVGLEMAEHLGRATDSNEKAMWQERLRRWLMYRERDDVDSAEDGE